MYKNFNCNLYVKKILKCVRYQNRIWIRIVMKWNSRRCKKMKEVDNRKK